MTQFGDILKEARLKCGLTQTELANKIGISQAYYNSIEKSKVSPPSIYVIERFAKILKYNLSKLREIAEATRLNFKQRKIEQQRKVLGVKGSIQFCGQSFRPIPILSEIPAGHPKEYTDQDYPPGIAEDYYEFKIDDPNAFFLRVEGDCMSPYIIKGDLLLISPNDKVESGDVAVVVNNKKEKVVGRVTIQQNQLILTPNNPVYPIIIWGVKDKPKIIGRVKEIIRRR